MPSSHQTFSLALILPEWFSAIPNLHTESYIPLIYGGEPEVGSPRNTGLVRGELSAVWRRLSEITLHRSKATCVPSQGGDTWLSARPSPTLPAPALQTKAWEGTVVSGAESLQLVPPGPQHSGQVLALLEQAWWIGCHGNMLRKRDGSHRNGEHPYSPDCPGGDFLLSPHMACMRVAGQDSTCCFSSLYQRPFCGVELPAYFIYFSFSYVLISDPSLATVRNELEGCLRAASRQNGRQLGNVLSWKLQQHSCPRLPVWIPAPSC